MGIIKVLEAVKMKHLVFATANPNKLKAFSKAIENYILLA